MAGLAMLAGCSVGPDFKPPATGLPEKPFAAPGASGPLAAPPDPNWWSIFHDPILTGLEQQVAAANLGVRAATIRLAESRSERNVAASQQLPTINGDAKVNHENFSQNGIVSLMQPLVPAGQPFSIQPITDYYTGFDASWELDLWGHVRRQVEAANAEVQANAEQRRGALVSALAEVARDYISLRGAQVQLAIARDNLKISEDVLKVAQERQSSGMQSALDTENAAAQIESVKAELPGLEQRESELINALSFLLDEPPGALRSKLATPRPTPVTPPAAPVGVPSELARRRPDIRAAEAKLHEATANIGVAVAAFYPSVQLNGASGFDALTLPKMWWASSLQYSFGPSVQLPIFNAGRLKSTVELRTAQQQEAALNYHRTVLQAWHDVVNALTAHRLEQERHARLKAQVEHARLALDIARGRYKKGVEEYINVLNAQRTALFGEQRLADSTTNLGLDLVQLFKALGGGWETTFPVAAAGGG
ncbi:efflux transporter outer membrane subunit [Rhodoblastus acidophilus]|uniref:Efflux transporter outer membrane subunit n=1 Tax=Candidatus Rhodoblastus alkanivorans TaxID=2954117 RepID=A0ABS9ZA77_9HYPH|nr:efflux transporter outer membrane subunit [Candidatus Rhodoblastus alkanivorans]MCI4677243.1 efflux transporter outer membrane subunit [Candidatus Rhodoblastus alkanivorans]MCI4684595.1 efflux transporter outer membrane subunit [Candidatus Rhodoblastus alkanivorans]MDI4641917.1 efflux transporter outer membrane subunit [Rhodoblastus acidophilus]